MITAIRHHDICCGHRVVGHEGKCQHLHGHNYRFEFHIKQQKNELDKVGRVIDFSVIKQTFCCWLESKWDHKILIWKKDPMLYTLKLLDPKGVFETNFNPTAENIAKYFVEEIAADLLQKKGYFDVTLYKLRIWETRKCSVIYEKKDIS